jgi:hypothetical protein
MASNHPIVVMTIVGVGLALIPAALASPTSDTCAALASARTALYSMLSAKDKSGLDTLNAKVQATSTRIDALIAGMTGADAKVAADFKTVWDQFKATREDQIVPAIYRGNVDDAKKIANGIQYKRFSEMWRILSCR